MFHKIVTSYLAGCVLAGLFLLSNSAQVQAKPSVNSSLVTAALQINNSGLNEAL